MVCTLHFLNYFDGLYHVLEIGYYLLPKGGHPHIKDDLSMATPPTQLCLAESQGKVCFKRRARHLRAELGPHSGCRPVSDQR